MEIVFEKKTKIKPLTLADFRHLYDYCMVAEEDGNYSGNQEQYWKRHKKIKAWVEDCIDTLERK